MTNSRFEQLVLVRHGETVGDSAIRLYGATDIGLSELGRRQMRRVRDALRAERFDAVITSPMWRSVESAAIVVDGKGPASTVVPDLREIDFGDWEGLTLAEVQERDPATHAEWGRGEPTFRFPGGDSRAEFRARVERAATDVISARSGRVLAVLHKGVIRMVLSALLGLDARAAAAVPIHLGSIHRLGTRDGALELITTNEITHLGPDHVRE